MKSYNTQADLELWNASLDLVGDLPGVHVCRLELERNPAGTHYTPYANVHWLTSANLAELKVRDIPLTEPRPLDAPLPDIVHHIIGSMGEPQEAALEYKPVANCRDRIWAIVDQRPDLSPLPALKRALLRACISRGDYIEYNEGGDLEYWEAYINEQGKYAERRVNPNCWLKVHRPCEPDDLLPLARLVTRLACFLEREKPVHPIFEQASKISDLLPTARHPNHLRYLGNELV